MNIHSFKNNLKVEKIDKRAIILNSTLELVAEKGFHGTSIDMIAKRSGVAAGTIYRYFTNKDELIYQLIRDVQQLVIKAMLNGYNKDMPYQFRFKLLWINMIKYYMSYKPQFQFAEQHRHSGYLNHLSRLSSVEILSPVLKFFIEGKKQKIIKDLPLYTIIALVRGPIIEMAKLSIDHGQNLSVNDINRACEACWDAIKLN